jgi:acyl carrier protein
MSLDARPQSADDPQQPLSDDVIRETVLDAMRSANLGRTDSTQLLVSADAPFFGPTSPLDSLGLVALLLDIEEALQERGCAVVLSDERAMSQTRSPFRTVQSLVAYIGVIARGE